MTRERMNQTANSNAQQEQILPGNGTQEKRKVDTQSKGTTKFSTLT